MNEKKKLYIMLGGIICVILLIVVVSVISSLSIKKTLTEIDEKMQSRDIQIFYLSRPTCHYCTLLKPVTDTLKEEFQLNYNEINTDHYTNAQLKKILNRLDVKIASFGTPYIVLTQNGKIIDSLNGYADENVVFEFFQKNGLIASTEYLAFTYIDYETLKNIWSLETPQLIMIGEAGSLSVEARNTLKPLIEKYKLSISYMDISSVQNNENYNEFLKMINHISIPEYPILMVVANGTVIAETSQLESNAYELFITANGFGENYGI